MPCIIPQGPCALDPTPCALDPAPCIIPQDFLKSTRLPGSNILEVFNTAYVVNAAKNQTIGFNFSKADFDVCTDGSAYPGWINWTL